LSGWHLRELTDDDLEEAVSLESASTTVGKRPLFSLSEVVASLVARSRSRSKSGPTTRSIRSRASAACTGLRTHRTW